MAQLAKRLAENAPGEFYVDSTCIDCDTCRQLAPSTFADAGEYSYVTAQPAGEEERRLALHALLACPTSSIGTLGKNGARAVMADFPLRIDGSVYYCGFNSSSSFGANSYFIEHSEGNWLVDSPRFLPHLVKQFEAHGGIRRIFLTHRDDVADADKFAAHFAAERIIHRNDASAIPQAEVQVEGDALVRFGDDFVLIPTPGHTRGHSVLLYKNYHLFTGDHLAYSRSRGHLTAFRRACWHSWTEQIRSMERLMDFDFEWVLPGHGDRKRLPAGVMKQEMRRLVDWMKKK